MAAARSGTPNLDKERADALRMLNQLQRKLGDLQNIRQRAVSATSERRVIATRKRRDEILSERRGVELLQRQQHEQDLHAKRDAKKREQEAREQFRSELYATFERKRRSVFQAKNEWRQSTELERQFQKENAEELRKMVRQQREAEQQRLAAAQERIAIERDRIHKERLMERKLCQEQRKEIAAEQNQLIAANVRCVRDMVKLSLEAKRQLEYRNRRSRMEVIRQAEMIKRVDLQEMAREMEHLQQEISQLQRFC
jgi:hypothetical protein